MSVMRNQEIQFLYQMTKNREIVLSNINQILIRSEREDAVEAENNRKIRLNKLRSKKMDLFEGRQAAIRQKAFVPPPTTPQMNPPPDNLQGTSKYKNSQHISEKVEQQNEQQSIEEADTQPKMPSFPRQSNQFELPQSISLTQHKHTHDFLSPPGEEDSFELQTQIQSNGPPLQAYQNFVKSSILNSEQKYQTENPLKAIEFWLIDILYAERVEVVFDIKRCFIKGDFQYIMKILSEAHRLKQYGGDDIDEQTIKKLFVEFIYKKEQESTIKFIEKYTILEPVIELAVVYYIICSSEPETSQRFLRIYEEGCKEIKEFYEIIAHAFSMKLNSFNDKRFVFEGEDKHITVKVKSDGILESWIM